MSIVLQGSNRIWLGAAVTLVTAFSSSLLRATDSAEYPAPVPNWVAPMPGEHPRLIFRTTDLPALKKKAQTDEGKKIIARLKVLLGGGGAMPELYSKDPIVDSVDEKAVEKHPDGTYTLSHAAGFGLLYQLTGDKVYADLARQCTEKIFEGQVDRDSRYNYGKPGTGFRTGFVLQSIALAYDLCYDAWPEDYRKSVIDRVQKNEFVTVKNKKYTLEALAEGGHYPPGSNHFGPYILGPAMVAMAFRGDPGADTPRLEKLLATSEASLQKLLGGGFGDGGWFAEGTSCGRISANNGVIPMIQSLKIAAGHDYITPRPDARYTVLHLMHEIVSGGKNPQIPHRGDYGDNNLYKRGIISHLGDFAQGMGSVKPEEAQAMAWIYDKFVEPGAKTLYNAQAYPHLAVYAFVNWPEKMLDPNEVFPHVMVDDIHGYYVARNQWQDADDVVITTLLKRGPHGFKGGIAGNTMAWGFGDKLGFGNLKGKTAYFRTAKDGSMELADEAGNSLVVDFGNTSGAPALLAATGVGKAAAGKKSKFTDLSIGATKVSVLLFGPGELPTPVLNGDTITVGKQTIRLDAGHLVLGQFAPAN